MIGFFKFLGKNAGKAVLTTVGLGGAGAAAGSAAPMVDAAMEADPLTGAVVGVVIAVMNLVRVYRKHG